MRPPAKIRRCDERPVRPLFPSLPIRRPGRSPGYTRLVLRRFVSLPSDGSAPGTFDLGRLFGLLHLFELVHLLELVRLLGSLRSDLFAQLLGPRISRPAAFHRLTQPLSQPLDVAPAQTSYERGPDRLRDRKKRRVGKECRSRWSPYH